MPQRQCTKTKTEVAKPSKRIRLPFKREEYDEIIDDKKRYREALDSFIEQRPELFPPEIEHGYQLYGLTRQSAKMPDVRLRRICLTVPDEQGRRQVYSIAPSFVMPYMTGDTDDVEKALFLRRFGVPYWALTYVFGRDDMYWQRMVIRIGQNDIVGTTIKDPE